MVAYSTPQATVQQVLLQHHAEKETKVQVSNVLRRLKQCRTSTLGYHLYRCREQRCGHLKYQYHSCRDRHCPNCGALKKEEWVEARRQELLPVTYYHVVFTLPHELHALILGHRKLLFKLLLDASSTTLLTFAKDRKYLGAQPGIISVLHTWGQQLSFHPHIHSIVSGGGIIDNHQWKEAKKSPYRFLFPVKAMQRVFRGKFLEALRQLIQKGEVRMPDSTEAKALLDGLYQKAWVVYAKAPFGGPQAVIEYLGRYTHKVAISNHRIQSIEESRVTFEYKDYADEGNKKLMTLEAKEFIRRFCQHILPKGFTKIRTYGYLANRKRKERINQVLKNMKLPLHKGLVMVPLQVRLLERYGMDIEECPCCKNKTMQLVSICYPIKRIDDG